MAQAQKQQISVVEFEKKIQIEMEHLIYFDRLKRHEAEKQAKQTVSDKFEIA